MTDAPHYRLDDLRRFAAALGSALGVPPARASALASHLLWFDAAGAARFGIEALPGWLERLESGGVDPHPDGTVLHETLGTAVLDGGNGLTPLVLARAGGIAGEKARDAGVGLVRVENLGPGGPTAPVAAAMAIGPMTALVLGPGPSWAVAYPSEEGLPALFDSALAAPPARSKTAARSAPPARAELLPEWAALLAPEAGWLVAAVALASAESLTALQGRVGAAVQAARARPGQILPAAWEASRRQARDRGITLTAAASKALARWGDRLEVEFPRPWNP